LVFSFNLSFALYRLHCCRVLQKVSQLTAGIMLRISTRLDSTRLIIIVILIPSARHQFTRFVGADVAKLP
jgi:hypothetical protein